LKTELNRQVNDVARQIGEVSKAPAPGAATSGVAFEGPNELARSHWRRRMEAMFEEGFPDRMPGVVNDMVKSAHQAKKSHRRLQYLERRLKEIEGMPHGLAKVRAMERLLRSRPRDSERR
jgi:hypothetical protein